MKPYPFFLGLAGSTALVVTGCAPLGSNRSDTIAEGVIFSVEYQLQDGRMGGFTRLNESKAVPGGNGSWNVDAHGRLTSEFLIVTRPQRNDLGLQIIPAHRLVNIQFGDGGIKEVNEGQPKPATADPERTASAPAAVGTNVSFYKTVEGAPPFSYSWRRGQTNGPAGEKTK